MKQTLGLLCLLLGTSAWSQDTHWRQRYFENPCLESLVGPQRHTQASFLTEACHATEIKRLIHATRFFVQRQWFPKNAKKTKYTSYEGGACTGTFIRLPHDKSSLTADSWLLMKTASHCISVQKTKVRLDTSIPQEARHPKVGEDLQLFVPKLNEQRSYATGVSHWRETPPEPDFKAYVLFNSPELDVAYLLAMAYEGQAEEISALDWQDLAWSLDQARPVLSMGFGEAFDPKNPDLIQTAQEARLNPQHLGIMFSHLAGYEIQASPFPQVATNEELRHLVSVRAPYFGGDSGGPVAQIGLDGKLRHIGVISSIIPTAVKKKKVFLGLLKARYDAEWLGLFSSSRIENTLFGTQGLIENFNAEAFSMAANDDLREAHLAAYVRRHLESHRRGHNELVNQSR